MMDQLQFAVPKMWSCNWNWCPETFRDGRDLRRHLQQSHLNEVNILQVRKCDLDAYLRSTEGRSGATDSLLAAVPGHTQTTRSSSRTRMEVDEPPRRNDSASVPPRRSNSASVPPRRSNPASVRGGSSFLVTPPPIPSHLHRPPSSSRSPSTSSDIRREPPHPRASFNAYPSPKVQLSDPSPASSVPSAKRRRTSFASYTAQSSPRSTPSAASVPPSPSLTHMVNDAINHSSEQNQASPIVDRKPSSSTLGARPAASSLPRRTGSGPSPSPEKPRPFSTSPTLSHPQPQASPSKLSAYSPRAASDGSAQAVEDALTQNVASPVPSQASSHASRAHDSQNAGGSSSVSSSVRPHTQSEPSSQLEPQSYVGSHAVESTHPVPPAETGTQVPELKVEPSAQEQELAYPHSSNPSSPPLPRRRTRSNSHSAQAAQVPPSTRTLRSRSKTPAPAPPPVSQTKILPLPRRTTRSRASSDTYTGTQSEMQPGAEPSAAGPRRATSKPPSAGGAGRKATRTNANPGGLPAVDEQPDEASAPVALQISAGPATGTRGTFRSGVLPLPRRGQVMSQLQASQTQSQAAARDVKSEPNADSLASQSQSQDGGGYSEAYGYVNPSELLTQKPFPSESQEW
ncbi:hypothetical protein BD309DRAFT_915455 [Dichomitus squalens]|nr:hypothetical protein BD309DRAFT_915455 [Dichomitus squalens]